jgi:biopolymer transport protein ExbD
MSIASRKMGEVVDCPRCEKPIAVPYESEAVSDQTQAKSGSSKPAKPAAAKPKATRKPVTEANEDSGFALRRPDTEFEDMDLTPMVDVTFLLLIFFMITASFSMQKSIDVPAPDPDKKGAAQSQMIIEDLLDASIRIDVDERNRILVDDVAVADADLLPDILRERMREEKKTEVLLSVHETAFWETTIKVCDACNEAGMQNIRLTAPLD